MQARSDHSHPRQPPVGQTDLEPPMTDWETLQTLIRNRLAVVADREHYSRDPEGHLERLKSASAELEACVSKLPTDIDPELRHFLDRQSYIKALDWLSHAADPQSR